MKKLLLIVDVSNINHNTIVIEIGPGLGALTQNINESKVIATNRLL